MAIAYYAKLKSGEWGVRVKGSVAVGDRLCVSTRSGKAKPEVVERIIWRDGEVSICALVAAPKKTRAPSRKRQSAPAQASAHA